MKQHRLLSYLALCLKAPFEMFAVWCEAAPRRSHINNTLYRSLAIFCDTTINPYDTVIGLWLRPWTNRSGSLFHWWQSRFLLSLKVSLCAGTSSQVTAGFEPLALCHARPLMHSFVRGYAPPCYVLNSQWVSPRSRWAWSRTMMKNQPGTHMLHLLSCLWHFLTAHPQSDFSFTWNSFFFAAQAVIFHVTSLLLLSVLSAGTRNIWPVVFLRFCWMRLRQAYIRKSCFSLIFLHLFPPFFIIFIYFVMLQNKSALDTLLFWFGLCRHKWDYMFKLYIKTRPSSCIPVTLHMLAQRDILLERWSL